MFIETMTVRRYRGLPRNWAVRLQLRATKRHLSRSKRRGPLDLLVVFDTNDWDRYDRRRVAQHLCDWRSEPFEAGETGFCVTFISPRRRSLFDPGYGYDEFGAPLIYYGAYDNGRATRVYAYANILEPAQPIAPHLRSRCPWLDTTAYAQTIGVNPTSKAPIVVGAYQPRPLRAYS